MADDGTGRLGPGELQIGETGTQIRHFVHLLTTSLLFRTLAKAIQRRCFVARASRAGRHYYLGPFPETLT